LLDGTIPVRVGKPIVTYFKHAAHSKSGDPFTSHAVESGASGFAGLELARSGFGALIANSGQAFETCEDRDGSMVKAWNQTLGWAITTPSLSATPEFDGVGEPSTFADAHEANESSSRGATDSSLSREVPSAVGNREAPINEGGQVGSTPETEPTEGGEGVEAPETIDLATEGVRFSVGKLQGSVGDADAFFWPGNTALNQMNIGVVGDLGTGKTQLLLALVAQLRGQAEATQSNPLSFLVFDYKKDFQSPEFLEKVGGEVMEPYKIRLNIFAIPEGYSPRAAFKKAGAFCDVLQKIYSGVGPVQRGRLLSVITELYKARDGDAPTLAEVRDAYAADEKADSVTAILDNFVLGEVFSDDRSELLSFDKLIDNKVLVIALDDFGADQNSKNALVALFLNVYYEYMLKSRKWPYTGTAPQIRQLNSFLLVDEAVNIMRYNFTVLMDLMLQGRQFGFGTILASQYLSHFKAGAGSLNYADPLLTWFIHKVPNVTAKELEQLGIPGATVDSASRIANLTVHEAYYSSYDFPGRFIVGTPYYKLE
jgi:hypothetical protein